MNNFKETLTHQRLSRDLFMVSLCSQTHYFPAESEVRVIEETWEALAALQNLHKLLNQQSGSGASFARTTRNRRLAFAIFTSCKCKHKTKNFRTEE